MAAAAAAACCCCCCCCCSAAGASSPSHTAETSCQCAHVSRYTVCMLDAIKGPSSPSSAAAPQASSLSRPCHHRHLNHRRCTFCPIPAHASTTTQTHHQSNGLASATHTPPPLPAQACSVRVLLRFKPNSDLTQPPIYRSLTYACKVSVNVVPSHTVFSFPSSKTVVINNRCAPLTPLIARPT